MAKIMARFYEPKIHNFWGHACKLILKYSSQIWMDLNSKCKIPEGWFVSRKEM